MRILFLTHYFPPEVNALASRTFDHCRAWVRAGDEVTVVTAVPHHSQRRVYPGHRNRPWQRNEVEGTDVIRLWSYLAPNKRVGRRTLSYLSFLSSVVAATPTHARVYLGNARLPLGHPAPGRENVIAFVEIGAMIQVGAANESGEASHHQPAKPNVPPRFWSV